MTPEANRSLPLCEVLEQEYAALSGGARPRPPRIDFTPEQILEPVALARRLLEGNDSVAGMLRLTLLEQPIAALADRYAAADVDWVRTALCAAMNTLMHDVRLFDDRHRRCFAGIKFRSQTVDRIDPDPDLLGRRLILEDTFPQLRKLFDIRLAVAYEQRHKQQLRALCLSGGGIRSATFALGVVQGLARNGLLDQFDYLSTVSGGGYIGGWLSAWIARTSLPQVIDQLRSGTRRPLEPEPAPIRHLRSYSNYLTPRLGFFSVDAWTLIATYLRNLLLNWLAFIPPLVALLSLPLLLAEALGWQPVGIGVTAQYLTGLVLAAAGAIGGVVAVRYIHVNRPRQRGSTEERGGFDFKRSQADFVRQSLIPLLTAVLAAVVCWAWGTSYDSPIGDLFRQWPGWVALGGIGASIHLIGWIAAMVRLHRVAERPPIRPGRIVVVIVSGWIVGDLASGLAQFAPPLWAMTPAQRGLYGWLAVPALLAVILLLSHLYVGYRSTRQSDAEREWSARFSGWMLIAMLAWFVAAGLTTGSPFILAWLANEWTWATQHAALLTASLSTIAGGSGIGAALIAKSASTPGAKVNLSPQTRSTMALGLATIFIAWLVVVLSRSGGLLIQSAQQQLLLDAPGSTGALLIAMGVVGALFGFGWLSGRLIDTNVFSLHAMYRMRLIRAYLGASRPDGERDPNRFTGFDDQDNLHLRELWPQPAPVGGNQRPLHLINATLNLVAGENLAWQERKAESFTFSPLHCGNLNVGYRPTQDDPRNPASGGYGGELGVTLGTAMAISGAAASPDMGYHSSPVLSLLLAFFNVRLGWWLGNPGHAGRKVFRRSSPESSLRPFIDEALGQTDDRNKYVYLSDGGHFENLGLYEMVLRRCHTIVVSDASSDPARGCDDLGNAIRKIRIDLGVPIDIDVATVRSPTGGSCALGTIRYQCVDGNVPDGVLIYLKPALSAGDAADVQSYARTSGAFPHETTADQWFSESQFESYRELGSHMIEEIVSGGAPPSGATTAWFVERVREYLSR